MVALANRYAVKASSEQERALRQLARELLFAQASDWPFHIRNDTAKQYATRRIQSHLSRFNRLAAALEHGTIEWDLLLDCEESDNVFSDVNWRHFCGSSSRAESRRSRRRSAKPGFPSLAHPDKGLEIFQPTRLRPGRDFRST
jgi:hypothetical protein